MIARIKNRTSSWSSTIITRTATGRKYSSVE